MLRALIVCVLRIRRLQPDSALAEQPLDQLLHVGMLVQVEAIADLPLLDDEVLGLFGLDDTAWVNSEFGIKITVKCLGLGYGWLFMIVLRSL